MNKEELIIENIYMRTQLELINNDILELYRQIYENVETDDFYKYYHKLLFAIELRSNKEERQKDLESFKKRNKTENI